MYDSKYAPGYTVAFSVNVVMCGIAVATIFVLRFFLKRANGQMDERERTEGVEMDSGVKRIRYTL
jgi:hypothetical protein